MIKYEKKNKIYYIKTIKGKNIRLELVKIISPIEKEYAPNLRYDVVLNKTNEVVGSCRASMGFSDALFYIGNVGYEIKPQFRGQGFAGEAVKFLTKVFKANYINTIFITNIPENKASYRVCEKLGAKFMGTYEIPENNIRRTKFGETKMNVFEYEF